MSRKVRTLAGLFLSTLAAVFTASLLIIVVVSALQRLINNVSGGGTSLNAILYFLSMGLSIIGGIYACRSMEERIAKLSEAYGPDSAETILKNCRESRIPYAVYLRSFALEGNSESILAQVLSGNVQPPPARKIEELLLAQIGGLMPVLALPDPSYPFHTPGFYRFRRLGTYWVDFLEPLLKDSSLIIYIAGNSAGVETELNLIRDLGLFDKTLVIVGNTRDLAKELGGHLERIFGAALHYGRASAYTPYGAQAPPSQDDRGLNNWALSHVSVILLASFLAIWFSIKLFVPVPHRQSSSVLDERGVGSLSEKYRSFRSFEKSVAQYRIAISERRDIASIMEKHLNSLGYDTRVRLIGLKEEVMVINISRPVKRQQLDEIMNEYLLTWLKDSGFTKAAIQSGPLNWTYDLTGPIY